MLAFATGCVVNGESTVPPGDRVTVEKVDAIARQLPPDIADGGTLEVGVNVPYAPNEFKDDDGTIVGFGVELVHALGDVLGLEAVLNEADFDRIIPAVQAGTFEMGSSSFTDTKEREESVDFVTYYSAGVQWAQRTGESVDPDNACGLRVAVQTTTIEDLEEVPAKSEECVARGLPPIDKVKYDSQDEAANASSSAGWTHCPPTRRSRRTSSPAARNDSNRPVRSSTPRPTDSSSRRVAVRSRTAAGSAVPHRFRCVRRDHRALGHGGRRDHRLADQRRDELRKGTMSESTSARSAEPRPDDPEPIRAVPLRHPGRWISGAIVLIALGLFAWGAATNEAYRWDIYARYLFDARITAAAWKTVQLTVLAMAIAVVLGVVLAVMRLSPNPVLRSVAWLYLWVFRGTPVYVQLVLWGLFPSIYKQIDLGIPFVHQFVHIDVQGLNAAFLFAVIGWHSTRRPTWRRSCAPASPPCPRAAGGVHGARHVVVADHPPHRPAAGDAGYHPADRQRADQHAQDHLAGRRGALQPRAVRPCPRHLGCELPADPAAARRRDWYLAITSLLMIGQYYLERHYSKGLSRQLTARQLQALADAQNVPVAEAGKPTPKPGAPGEEHI